MEDGQFQEAESEEHKSLPFNFGAPRLQPTQDNQAVQVPAFGHCEIDLLRGTPFHNHPWCFLSRAKGACNQDDWKMCPDLIDKAMKATVETFHRPDIIQVKSKVSGAKTRLYDTLQVIPNTCACRVSFGGDGHHHKLQTGSSATPATQTMAKMLMAKFKAFPLVLNKYQGNDGIDPRQDISRTYWRGALRAETRVP